MSRNYGFDEAAVQITKPDGCKLAIFDVSPTIECRWIAISNKEWSLLEVFGSTREMLKFVAREQINGATIPNEDGWLDEQAGMDGFDTWDEYVSDERGESDERDSMLDEWTNQCSELDKAVAGGELTPKEAREAKAELEDFYKPYFVGEQTPF